MDHLASFAVSAAGMDVERLRVEAAALNLANAHGVAGADGAVFRPLRVVVRALPPDAASFAERLHADLRPPTAFLAPSAQPARRVHEPGHPLADAQGFVRYPAVDAAAEMVTLMAATRAYEANVVALNAARSLALKALEIGG